MELNPNHPVTQAIHDHWHKIAALILYKLEIEEIVISANDINLLGNSEKAVMFEELEDGIHVRLVSMEEAERLAVKEGGKLN